ncbi:NifB/NifX family molybdenum-iron cluster-binding protein [Fusobacterium ulcerans]|mgnify:CR=1 FL=1|uniref:Dinitrogenase iron-molybdenum cofactor biosynthesis domain-containing protein n=1 Tax=Fusobacterium ulcerans 12-1B TaxID=457404 RepID=H1PYG7_9FUSO|nr:NifB/NifX family molybdenum-iron cluster-binding protein [Fusobacterium ulcerans]EHO77304.1 hypothetical protein HMPREF0402_03460 [Fusobacterium ulcerans 12-1B]
MKIAIALEENKYESQVDKRFGRAAYFLIIDIETKKYKIVENEAKNEVSGAGLKVIRNLIAWKVDEIVAEEVGPKAVMLIKELEIPIYKLGNINKVEEVLKAYNQKKLKKFDFSNKCQGLKMV